MAWCGEAGVTSVGRGKSGMMYFVPVRTLGVPTPTSLPVTEGPLGSINKKDKGYLLRTLERPRQVFTILFH